MSISKATADRHQRILLELVAQPGNNVCADCKRLNPRWASHNLGVFLCVNCASVHRKIGVHVSKVKSLTLDSWSKEQLENMKTIGNVKSNQLFNPDERRHPPPANLEHTDRGSDLEVFIRSKYEKKQFMASPSTTQINRPASTSASNTLNVPEPGPRSKSTPIRQSTTPVPSVVSAGVVNPVVRPPRTSSILPPTTATASTQALSAKPRHTTSVSSVPQLQQQPQFQPTLITNPVLTPQSTGMSMNVLGDMMSIQSPISPLSSGASGNALPAFPNTTPAPFGVSTINPPLPSIQQPLNTGLQNSSFSVSPLATGNSLAHTPTPPIPAISTVPGLGAQGASQSPFSLNQNQNQNSPFGFPAQSLFIPSLSSSAGGSIYTPLNTLGTSNGNLGPQRSETLPPLSNTISPAYTPVPTMVSSMPMTMSPLLRAQVPTGNPFLQQQQPTLGAPPLTNMYTGNPLQPFPQRQQQQGQFFPGQLNPSPNNFSNPQAPFAGSQRNPFSNNWAGSQQNANFGAGWSG